MKKIFYGIPVKGEMPCWAVKNLIAIARTRFDGFNVVIRILEGSPINVARNELAQCARDEKADFLVMQDRDLNVGVKEFGRLLSHDLNEPIVCSLYAQRGLSTNWHVYPNKPPSPEEESGLMAMHHSAIGFSRIAMSVFDILQSANPDRVGQLTDRGGGTKQVWDFFNFELVGLNTPASRLKEILVLADQLHKDGTENTDLKVDARFVASRIRDFANTTYLAENMHYSEDIFFCKLCRDAGIPIKIDTKLIVQHATEVMLPIPTQQLQAMISEDWRQAELDQLNGSNN